jgi:hypothetical protein
MVFNLGYPKTSYIHQNETQEILESWTSLAVNLQLSFSTDTLQAYRSSYLARAVVGRWRSISGVAGTLTHCILSWKHQSTYLHCSGTKSDINSVNCYSKLPLFRHHSYLAIKWEPLIKENTKLQALPQNTCQAWNGYVFEGGVVCNVCSNHILRMRQRDAHTLPTRTKALIAHAPYSPLTVKYLRGLLQHSPD